MDTFSAGWKSRRLLKLADGLPLLCTGLQQALQAADPPLPHSRHMLKSSRHTQYNIDCLNEARPCLFLKVGSLDSDARGSTSPTGVASASLPHVDLARDSMSTLLCFVFSGF